MALGSNRDYKTADAMRIRFLVWPSAMLTIGYLVGQWLAKFVVVGKYFILVVWR